MTLQFKGQVNQESWFYSDSFPLFVNAVYDQMQKQYIEDNIVFGCCLPTTTHLHTDLPTHLPTCLSTPCELTSDPRNLYMIIEIYEIGQGGRVKKI